MLTAYRIIVDNMLTVDEHAEWVWHGSAHVWGTRFPWVGKGSPSACLIKDRQSHIADDIRAVDDQRMPFLATDDSIACQVTLLKGLHG